MDGLFEILPGAVPVEIAGRIWRIGPLDLADYAEIERRLVRDRPQPLVFALEAIARENNGREKIDDQSESRPKQLLGLAYDDAYRAQRVARRDVASWLGTSEGMVFEFWLRLRKEHPDMTLSATENLLAAAGNDGFRKIASAAAMTGEAPLGNVHGRSRQLKIPTAASRYLGEESFAA